MNSNLHRQTEMFREDLLMEALKLCGEAAGGNRFAWPRAMEERMSSGTELGWRVNRIGEIVRSVEQGTFEGRETRAFGGYYKDRK